MRKVKMMTRLQHPDYNIPINGEVELPDEMAKGLVDSKQAEYVDDANEPVEDLVINEEPVIEEVIEPEKNEETIDEVVEEEKPEQEEDKAKDPEKKEEVKKVTKKRGRKSSKK